MFILDDILLAPYSGIKWLFKEIQRQAQEELDGEADRITTDLTNLYRQFESNEITEQEFEERETVLLDRLDELQEESNLLDEEYDEEYEDDDEEYEDDDKNDKDKNDDHDNDDDDENKDENDKYNDEER